MISLDPWKGKIGALKRGETIRVNHDNCDAGSDHRRRLYLTRPMSTPNVCIGYCHNCQDKGFYNEDSTFVPYRDFQTHKYDLPNGPNFVPPMNMIDRCESWPTDAIAWRIQKSLAIKECDDMGMKYDPSTHRVFIPQWDDVYNGEPAPLSRLMGYQLRCLDDHGPKYLTAKRDPSEAVSTLMRNHAGATKLGHVVSVIVEDLPSGILLSRALRDTDIDLTVTVNYGTKVTPEVLYRNKQYDLGIVWLDNDGEHITDQAHKIKNVWSMLSGSTVVIEGNQPDPKNLVAPVLVDVIRKHIIENG